jgi:hypothetical protein
MRRTATRGLAVCAAALLGLLIVTPVLAMPLQEFPAGFEGYHDYAEMMADIDVVLADRPAIISKQSIGQSYEGRTIWAIKISDNVGADEPEPEVLFEHLHHAREHLTVEQALEIIHLLTDNYRANPANITTQLEQRVSDIVNSREIWIVPMVNPDGAEYDISSGQFQNWRRNRQPVPDSSALGVDLNRNWGYKWGCCGGSSGKPGTSTYRGPSAWYAPEVVALRDFVLSRRVGGVQQISEAISWHTFNEQVMWPYGYTTNDVPRDMTADDHAAFVKLGTEVAQRNGYTPQQMSDLYILDGGASDWLYGDQRIFAFTIEMYPTDGSHVGGFYPPDSVIERETTRNDDAVLWFLEQAGCPFATVAALAVTHCGPLNDDFETGRGWTIDPAGSDTATAGRFERAIPQKTSNSAGVKQRRYGFSAQFALVTGAAAGAGVAANDVDGGTTSARSPLLALGGAGSTGWHLDFQYSFAHNAKATAADYLRVLVNGTEVFRAAGVGANRNAVWTPVSVDLDEFAGQSVRVTVEATDGAADSLVEAGIDDVRVYQAP